MAYDTTGEPPFPYFREIAPLPQWSSWINVNVPYDEFIETTRQAAAETRHRFSGTLATDPTSGNVTSFVHTRFPRHKYGKPFTTDQCMSGMQHLASSFHTVAEQEAHQTNTSRIVLGLYEGQHASGARKEPTGPDHTVAEIASTLGRSFLVTAGEVLVLRVEPDAVVYYSEEIAIVTFPTSLKYWVYNLADIIKQERFSVEDFGQSSQSYMVETRYCKEPDPAPQ